MKKFIDKLLALFAKLFGKKDDAPTPAPAPAPVAPPISVKPVPPPVVSGRVTLPITGHTLDLPGTGETMVPYFIRVAHQAGFSGNPVGLAGSIMLLGDAVFGGRFNANDQSTWPVSVDAFLNRNAYESPEERAYREGLERRDREAAEAAAVMQPGQLFDIRNLGVDDLVYLRQRHLELQSFVGPTAWVNAFINWTQFQGGYAPSAEADAAAGRLRTFNVEDTTGYNGPLKAYA